MGLISRVSSRTYRRVTNSMGIEGILPSEVATHNRKSSCWVIIHNKVYDITEFLVQHPGGEEVGHSNDARDMLADYEIGTIHPDRQTKTPPQGQLSWLPSDKNEAGNSSSTLILIGSVAVMVAIVAWKFM